MMREIPVLDDSRCIACGDCVGVCPTDCIAMGELIPWLIRPADCVSCAACAFICPTEAIQLRRPVAA